MDPTRTKWAVVLAAALSAAPAWAEEGAATPVPPGEPPAAPLAPPPPRRTGWRVQGLPLLNFNSDEGVGYGARALLVDAGDGSQKPYRYSLMAQFFQTTRGVVTHRLALDAPGFLESPWRLGVNLGYFNDRFLPYFGLGGASTYEKRFDTCEDRAALEGAPDVCPGNPEFRGLRYYTFEQRVLPNVALDARRPIHGPLQMSLGYRFRLTRVKAFYTAEDLGQTRDSRLMEDARAGLLTGIDATDGEGTFRTAEVSASLMYDTRDNEPAPVVGMFHELALRGAHGAVGSGFGYWGATAHLRFYHPVFHERLVAALRLFGDAMGGDVPFYLLGTFGGVDGRDSGIGGVFTTRGIVRRRVVGEVKALVNAELRWRFLSVEPANQLLDFELVAFFDAGKAWADLSFKDAGLAGYSGGGGLRIGWEKLFIVRADYGVSPLDGNSAFYLEFNHMF